MVGGQSRPNQLSNSCHLLTHDVYWLNRRRKYSIQFPRDFSVSGASFLQILGICPRKRDLATSSNSLLIPTSPAKACLQNQGKSGETVRNLGDASR